MSEELEKAPTPQGVAMNEADNFDLMQRQSQLFAASQIVPTAYRDNMPNCFIALDMARRLKANPMIIMQNLYIVHGNPAWSSQFLIAMINSSGRFTPLKFKFNKDKTSCFAYCTDKISDEVLEGSTITMKMAHDEGWSTKAGSKWKTMPEQMLMYRSAAFFARVYCPEGTMGIQTRDEVIDIEASEAGGSMPSPSFMDSMKTAEKVAEPVEPETTDADPTEKTPSASGDLSDKNPLPVDDAAAKQKKKDEAKRKRDDKKAEALAEKEKAVAEKSLEPKPTPKAEGEPEVAEEATFHGIPVIELEGDLLSIYNRCTEQGITESQVMAFLKDRNRSLDVQEDIQLLLEKFEALVGEMKGFPA